MRNLLRKIVLSIIVCCTAVTICNSAGAQGNAVEKPIIYLEPDITDDHAGRNEQGFVIQVHRIGGGGKKSKYMIDVHPKGPNPVTEMDLGRGGFKQSVTFEEGEDIASLIIHPPIIEGVSTVHSAIVELDPRSVPSGNQERAASLHLPVTLEISISPR